MILIHNQGLPEDDENEAAIEIRRLITESWPWIEKEKENNINIFPSVQCHGQRVRDIDLVLIIRLIRELSFRPSLPLSEFKNGKEIEIKEIIIRSLCLAIEVKNHSAHAVKFKGKNALVLYARNGTKSWHSASDQSERQKYSLKQYLEQHDLNAPWIVNLLWFRNLLNSDLPVRPHNMLGQNSSWDLFLNVIAQQNIGHRKGYQYVIDAFNKVENHEVNTIENLLGQTLQPTALDRKRMDLLTKTALRDDWVSSVGNRQLTFRGHGGVGKTILMLQLAFKLCTEVGLRIIVLTYNRALVSDIRRLLTMIGLSDDIGCGKIHVQTVHSFLSSLFNALGVLSPGNDILRNFDQYKQEILALFKKGEITSDDISKLVQDRSEDFYWNYILVDEVQDWPDNERDLLRYLHSHTQFVIADGVDQLVRQTHPTDWISGLPEDELLRVPLQKSLRMKRGLARFVNVLSLELLPGWQVIPNDKAPGGRVVVVVGDYFSNPELHEEIMFENKKAGNEPVDMLVCVPPSLVGRRTTDDLPYCLIASQFEKLGLRVWDGVNEQVRGNYPTRVEQLRILQYDSCRGLEGWTVINLGFDDFFNYKVATYKPSDDPASHNLYDPLDSERFAARWLMIPLTRAIDTLVIQIKSTKSKIGEALKTTADQCGDMMEWYEC